MKLLFCKVTDFSTNFVYALWKSCRTSTVPPLNTLLKRFWRISLYLTDDCTVLQSSILCDVKFRQTEGNGRKFRHRAKQQRHQLNFLTVWRLYRGCFVQFELRYDDYSSSRICRLLLAGQRKPDQLIGWSQCPYIGIKHYYISLHCTGQP